MLNTGVSPTDTMAMVEIGKRNDRSYEDKVETYLGMCKEVVGGDYAREFGGYSPKEYTRFQKPYTKQNK